MVDIRRDDRPARGDLAANELDVNVFAQCHITHFRGYLTAARVVHLGNPLAGFRAQRHRFGPLPLLGGRPAAPRRPPTTSQAAPTAFLGSVVPPAANPPAPPGGRPCSRKTSRPQG